MSTLNLWKHHLGLVPEEVWDQKDLQTLILADNGLQAVSARIGDLQQLRTLDLGHNQLATLPEELGNLTHLREFLYLHDNRLTSLPQSLANLTSLRYLDISSDLPRLEKLDLRWVTTLAVSAWLQQLEACGCVVYR